MGAGQIPFSFRRELSLGILAVSFFPTFFPATFRPSMAAAPFSDLS